MAKTYLDTVKYIIKIDFEIKGIVDKPDIIGAVFGQSEGLLGEELDLRELQKNGRIGRIEITQNTNMGLTKGTLSIPSSLDMVETSILAAAVESVDKVGPFESKFWTANIEDTRSVKRKEIQERAKSLLKRLMVEQIPDSQEITEKIREDTRAADIESYGPEKVPCGPDILEEDSIIVVEGRADVLNLLKNGIKNVIAMGGAKPTKSLIDLCKQKQTILFVDGDRGGALNVRKMADITKVDFVAQAPEGKEVEELQRKEIVMALRKKTSLNDFLSSKAENHYTMLPSIRSTGFQPRMQRGLPVRGGMLRGRARPGIMQNRMFGRDRMFTPRDRFPRNNFQPFQRNERPFEQEALEPRIIEEKASPQDEAAFKPLMEQLKGSLKAKFLDENNNEIAEVEVREMLNALKQAQNVKTIIFDGIITKRVVDEAKTLGIKTIIGVKKGKIENEKEIKLLTIAV